MEANKNESLTTYIDKNVIYLLVIIFLISSTALAYRFYADFPCESVMMDIKGKEYRVGEFIRFTDLTEKAEEWDWDLGDSTLISNEKEVVHNYKTPGEYVVKLKVNNSCETIKKITIRAKKIIRDPSKIPNLDHIPESIEIGQLLTVVDSTKRAYSWEWRFGDNAEADATTQKASYTYEGEPGPRTISLIINKDTTHIANKIIKVYAKVEEEEIRTTRGGEIEIAMWDTIEYERDKDQKNKDKLKKAPYISESAFKQKLVLLSKKQADVKEFMDYFCDEINKPILVNGESTTFLKFCYKIQRKRTKILQLTIFRNEGSNCIQNMSVITKKSLLKKIKDGI
ncbi:PKD domain-containing protein [Aquimarina sp. AD10]|uniref:PKD domain-containing protein n=1 Tax=Aquimarina sp. AD10 TaxID=1714849 RepID=UPI000E4E0D21|nr:PKD domain-containing protein [Aquimarina sp. AD10]AXT60419.1 PKD domain-containing protein [Aquimarina sp. AD10]RKN01146.1 PKD domain-containing protein [Aquimarina sp. AD10]